ncbi:MAG: hypothetical protein MI974_00155 [Chitinophagales bacterium]|nr:hypothetical protein [Chitinophagales bacterium]
MTDSNQNTNDEKYNRKILKEKFENGKRPSGQNFAALIDSMVNIIDDNLVKNNKYGLVLYPTNDNHIALTFKTSCGAETAWSVKVENNDDESINLNLVDHEGNTALMVKGNTFLGVRNISPEYPLDVDGDTRIKGTLIIEPLANNSATSQPIQIKRLAASSTNAGGLQFLDGQGKTLFFLETGGKIGVNTASPEYPLDVDGDTRIKGTLIIEPQANDSATSQAVQIKQVAASDSSAPGLQFLDGQGQAIFFLGTDGKIGIKNTQPQHSLDFRDDIWLSKSLIIHAKDPATDTTSLMQIQQVTTDNNTVDSGTQFVNQQGQPVFFIGTNGNLGIANTQPKSQLDIKGSLTTSQLVGNIDPGNLNGQIHADDGWYDIATNLTEFDAFELIAQAWYKQNGGEIIYEALWDHIMLARMVLNASYPSDQESIYIKYQKTLDDNGNLKLQMRSTNYGQGLNSMVNYNLLKRNRNQ